MALRIKSVLVTAAVVILTSTSIESSSGAMTKVILETDMTFDVDDVGALAVLHALADPYGVEAVKVINRWFGRDEVPVGQFEGELHQPDKSRYLSHVANLVNSPLVHDHSSAMDFYEEILNSQNDDSVTIVSVGFLNNLATLLRTHPTLIEQKVSRLVAMGGRVNDKFNFVRHGLVDESQFVIERWPTQLIVTDFGGDLHTGVSLSSTSLQNPIREAYFRWFNGSFKGRSSWDQIAVLVGVRGEGGGFEFVGDLTGRLRNGFTWQFDGKRRAYARPTKSRDFYTDEIEALMSVEPRAH